MLFLALLILISTASRLSPILEDEIYLKPFQISSFFYHRDDDTITTKEEINYIVYEKLIEAITNGEAGMTEMILKTKPKFPSLNRAGQTVLHLAANNKFDGVLCLLIKYKPDLINSIDSNGNTPLHLASENGLLKSIKLLLLLGAFQIKNHKAHLPQQLAKNEESLNLFC